MTDRDTGAQPSEWTSARIAARVDALIPSEADMTDLQYWQAMRDIGLRVGVEICDDYQQLLAAAQERIRTLEANADPEALVIAYGKGYADAQEKAAKRIAELEADIAERQVSFDLRWNADMEAIMLWQETTGEELKWPNHVDLCVWLMEQLAAKQPAVPSVEAETIREALIAHRKHINATHLTFDGERHEKVTRINEAMSWLDGAGQGQETWLPVEDGEYHPLANYTIHVYSGGTQLEAWEGHIDHNPVQEISLLDYRLCRRVTVPATEAQDAPPGSR